MNKPKMHTIASFIIPKLQYIDESHQATQTLPDFAQDPDILLELYRLMTTLRMIDKKAVNLQRTGKLGTYASALGQEAISIGVGHAMRKQDLYVPSYRDQGVLIQRGVKISEILNYWGGDERANNYACGSDDFPPSVPIATQILHAAGAAYAIKYQKKDRVVVTLFGDGATSKGDFYEAMNLAGVWQLPVIFVVNNNQWAISVPRNKQTAAQTIAQKAIAAGIEGLQVDGNDVIAVRKAMVDAIEKITQHHGGPTLIEAVSYRLSDHTTADDAKRYQSEEERKIAWKHEPIARLGYYLEAQNLWSREKEAALQEQCSAEVEKGIEEYLNTPPPSPLSMFDHLYAELPRSLIEQRDQLAESIE